MKTIVRITALLVVLAVLVLPSTVFAKGLADDKVVFGGTYTLESGETLDGDLGIFGGVVVLEEDSTVLGDIILFGGTLEVSGEVQGEIIAFGGTLALTDTAVVGRNVVTIGGLVHQADGAQVRGDLVENPGAILLPNFIQDLRMPVIQLGVSPVFNFACSWLEPSSPRRWLYWRYFLPTQTGRVAHTASGQPLVSGGVGLLTAVLFPPVMLLLIITVCLIPVSVLLAIAVAVIWAFGLISLGYEVGMRLARMANREWAPALAAGLGTFILILVVNGIGIIPCVGAIVQLLVGALGLGAVLLTRFGTQPYPVQVVAPSVVSPAEIPRLRRGSSMEDSPRSVQMRQNLRKNNRSKLTSHSN
jgi:hypothetical protein